MPDPEPTWEQLKANVAKTMGSSPSDEKIREIQISPREPNKGERVSITVGGLDPTNNEEVLAIFADPPRNLFLVVTSSRGSLSGTPLLYGRDDEAQKVD